MANFNETGMVSDGKWTLRWQFLSNKIFKINSNNCFFIHNYMGFRS